MPGPIAIERGSANPVLVGGTLITPQARTVIVRLPFGGFVWNQPIGVRITRGQQVGWLPIVDLTARIQLALVATLVLFGIYCQIRLAQQRREQQGHGIDA